MADNNSFERIDFEPGDVIVKEGEKGKAAYLIVKGKVEIRAGISTSNPVTLATLRKGEVFGELAMFDNQNHMASVIAAEPTTVSAIYRSEFQDRLNQMDPVLRAIVLQLVGRTRQMADDLRGSDEKVNWANWKRE